MVSTIFYFDLKSNILNRSTAQLGHFWIELRIKNPHNPVRANKDNGFIKSESKNMDEDNYDRQNSEENRLVDYNDDYNQVEKISEKPSDLSNESSEKCNDSNCSHNECGKRQFTGRKPLSQSRSNVDNENNQSNENAENDEDDVYNFDAFSLNQKEQAGADAQPEKEYAKDNNKWESNKLDGFELDDLDLIE